MNSNAKLKAGVRLEQKKIYGYKLEITIFRIVVTSQR